MSPDACRALHASLHGVLLTGQQLLWTSQHASGSLVPCVRLPETDFTEGVPHNHSQWMAGLPVLSPVLCDSTKVWHLPWEGLRWEDKILCLRKQQSSGALFPDPFVPWALSGVGERGRQHGHASCLCRLLRPHPRLGARCAHLSLRSLCHIFFATWCHLTREVASHSPVRAWEPSKCWGSLRLSLLPAPCQAWQGPWN